MAALPAPFAMVPDYVLAEASPAALRVYVALALRVDHKTGVCWPSRASIARTLDVSSRTVDRAVRSLIEMGAIEVTHRFTEGGDQTSNLYMLPFAVARRGGATPMSPGRATHDATPLDTHVTTPVTPVSHNPDSGDLEPIDPEMLNAFPREEGETIGAYLVRIANLGGDA